MSDDITGQETERRSDDTSVDSSTGDNSHGGHIGGDA